ncbi:MAG: hypothetical protein ACOX6T_26355 [Myxococcales bacterium]|jgi:hypothetical protein
MDRLTKNRTTPVRRSDTLRALLVACCVAGCTTTGAASSAGSEGEAHNGTSTIAATAAPQAALRAFLDATEAGDFEAAYRLLAGSWRARYTPERLAADFDQVEGAARERLTRAALAASREPIIAGNTAELPVGGGKCVRLVKEDDGWKIQALE